MEKIERKDKEQEGILFMKIAKRIAAVFLLVLLCLPAGLPVQAAAVSDTVSSTGQTAESGSGNSRSKTSNGVMNTDDFEIKVVCGLDGNYRSGAAIPVTIYIKSLKKDFEGTVRMIVPGGSDYDGTASAAYEKEILLSAGVQKVVTMSVYSTSSLATFKFQLEDSSGDILVDKSVTMKGRSADGSGQALAGVLSDDYTALNYIDGLSVELDSYVGSVQLVELNEDIFPEQASGLEALSYLIINSYDTSVLSENQYAAVKNWVEQGGVLIIGTGSDYRRTLSGFQDDFLEGTIGAAMEGAMELYGETPDAKPSDAGLPDANEPISDALKYTKDQGIVELSLKDGEPLKGIFRESEGQPVLVWNRDYKQGHVVVTAFNLGMEPVVSWTQASEMAELLLDKSASGYSSTRIEELSYGGYSSSSWILSQALDGLHDIHYPDMKLMWIVFLVFVIMAGPGLYLLLKLVDKREWMWILVPVLAVGCTAGIFMVTQDLRIRDPRETSVTTLYYDMDEEYGVQELVDMAIQVPGADRRDIDLDSSLVNLKLGGEQYDYGYYNPQGQQNQYEYKTSVRETAGGYVLGIRNRETFGSTYMNMRHVTEDNSTCGLELEIERKTTGIRGRVTNQTGQDLKSVSVYASGTMVMIGDLKAGESAGFTEKDNRYMDYDMYNISFSGFKEGSREYEQQRNIWNLFCEEYLYGMDDNDIYTYAYMGDHDADYVLDEKVKENNVAVLVRRDTVQFSDYGDAQILRLYDYAVKTGDGWDGDGQLYVSDIEVDFNLNSLITSVHALIRAADSQAVYGSTDQVTVYGYNVETKQYDELFKDGEIMEFKDKCPYLDEKGMIRLRFTCPNAGYENFTPQITVVGGED